MLKTLASILVTATKIVDNLLKGTHTKIIGSIVFTSEIKWLFHCLCSSMMFYVIRLNCFLDSVESDILPWDLDYYCCQVNSLLLLLSG